MEMNSFIILIIGVVLTIVGVKLSSHRRKAKRRKSLHHDSSTGAYYWTDFDGMPRQSRTDPSKKDGTWDQEDAAQGGGWSGGGGGWGDGGGSDGGGGGGGGD